ncbi:MAG: ATP-binding protein [Desulfovibrionaceae bacterium]|nr:ATP-binding protein [Desulfovibrionaceae bacterium]
MHESSRIPPGALAWHLTPSFDSTVTDRPRDRYTFFRFESFWREQTGRPLQPSDFRELGLADDSGLLTVAGTLMADQRLVFSSRVFCTRWNGLDKACSPGDDALDSQEFEGRLVHLLEESCHFVRRNSCLRFRKLAMSRLEKPDYRQDAVREAIVNALVHRDYRTNGSEVQIHLFDDRMEIWSPGGMTDGSPIQDRDAAAVPAAHRNPVLVGLFRRLGLMTGEGGGLKTILSSLPAELDVMERAWPGFYSTRTHFQVMLKNLNWHADRMCRDLDPKLHSLLRWCRESRTREQIGEYMGIPSARFVREHVIGPLLKSGYLRMVYPDSPRSRYQKYVSACWLYQSE